MNEPLEDFPPALKLDTDASLGARQMEEWCVNVFHTTGTSPVVLDAKSGYRIES